VHLPYCIEKQEDGTYVVLNREYKPLGFKTRDYIDYSSYPICVRIKGMTARAAAKISYEGSPDVTTIYLYNDACIPTHSKANMDAYLKRLGHLARLKVT
jgi:hypothetical protein